MKLHYAEHILETDEKQFISKELKDLIGKCDTGGGDSTNYIETFEQLKEIANSSLSSRLKSLDLKPGCHIKMTEPLEIRFTDYATFNGNGATIETTGLDMGLYVIFGSHSKFINVRILGRGSKQTFYSEKLNPLCYGVRQAINLNFFGALSTIDNCIFDVTREQLAINLRVGNRYKVTNCIFIDCSLCFGGTNACITNNIFSSCSVLTNIPYNPCGFSICYYSNYFQNGNFDLTSGELILESNLFNAFQIETTNAILYDNDKYNYYYCEDTANINITICNNSFSNHCILSIDPRIATGKIENNSMDENITFSVIETNSVDRIFKYGTTFEKIYKMGYKEKEINKLNREDENKGLYIRNNSGCYVKLFEAAIYSSMLNIENTSVIIQHSKEKITDNLMHKYNPTINFPHENTSYFCNFAFRFLTDEALQKIFTGILNVESNQTTKIIFWERKLINNIYKVSVYSGKDIEINSYYDSENKFKRDIKNCVRYDFEISIDPNSFPSYSSIIPTETIIGNEFIGVKANSDNDYYFSSNSSGSDLPSINIKTENVIKIYNYLKCDNCKIYFEDRKAFSRGNNDVENTAERSLFFKNIILNNCTLSMVEYDQYDHEVSWPTRILKIYQYDKNKLFVISNSQISSRGEFLQMTLNRSTENNCNTLISNITNYSNNALDNIFVMPENKQIFNGIDLMN